MKNRIHLATCLVLILILQGSFLNKAIGKTTGLFIAIDAYNDTRWENLPSSVSDATAITALLKKKYSFDEIIPLYDEDATKTNITESINTLVQSATEEDNVLIFYSGYSFRIQQAGFWIPYDATSEDSTWISHHTFNQQFANSLCQHILVLSDADFTAFQPSNIFANNDNSPDYYQKINKIISRQVVTTAGDRPALDLSGKQSVLTKYLLKFLTKNEQANLTTNELFQLINFPIAANSPNTPQIGHMQDTGHEGGQFIFQKKLPKQERCSLKVSFKEGINTSFGQEGGVLHAVATGDKVKYEWLNGITPLMMDEASLKVTESGEYTVIVTDNKDCTHAATIKVNVELPQAFVAIEEGSEVEFTHRGLLHAKSNYKDVLFEWRRNNFPFSEQANVTVTQSGTYTVNIKTKDGRILASSSTEVKIKDRKYRVKIGDTVQRIAKKFYNNSVKAELIYQANPFIKRNQVLRVGIELIIPADIEDTPNVISNIQLVGSMGFPPFSGASLYNKGILTDIVGQVFTKMDRKVTTDFMTLNKVKSATFVGTFTAAYPFVKSLNEEASFLFSEPLYQVLNVLFAKSDSKINFAKPKDLKGKKIGILQGYNIDAIIKLTSNRVIKVVPCASILECFKLLKKGEVDLIACPQTVGLMLLKQNNDLKINDFKILDQTIGSTNLHLIIARQHPNSQSLINTFNSTFKQMQKKGIIEEIIDKHFDFYERP